ncbi:MAG TPA: type II secretion system F family protein [Steroidobacteraceae bacterium]|nr:type II secretion system F family protein [Steroidobacteraceae bacterium]
MSDLPFFYLAPLAVGAFSLSVFGLRGVLGLRAALREADFESLSAPEHWPVTRAFCGLCVALPVLFAAAALGNVAWLAALTAGALGYTFAPLFRDSALQRARQELLDDLALHLDLMALAMEAGSSLAAALGTCAERAPDGVLRRVWVRIVLEVHAGADLFEALRALDQRLGLRPFSTLIAALRSAERLGMDPAAVLRERARQAAANRFARAERRARAAPLKLWATLMLCIAPCSLVLLAFPVARMLAAIAD